MSLSKVWSVAGPSLGAAAGAAVAVWAVKYMQSTALPPIKLVPPVPKGTRTHLFLATGPVHFLLALASDRRSSYHQPWQVRPVLPRLCRWKGRSRWSLEVERESGRRLQGCCTLRVPAW